MNSARKCLTFINWWRNYKLNDAHTQWDLEQVINDKIEEICREDE